MNPETLSDSPATGPILLVDADSTRREPLTRALEAAGFVVHVAGDAEECLRAVAMTPPLLVVLDEGGAEDDSLQLCRAIHGRPEGKDVDIALVVEPRDDLDLEKAAAAGATEFIERSAGPALIVHRIRRILGSSAPADRLRLSDMNPRAGLACSQKEELLKVLGDHMPLARSEANHIAVLFATLDDTRLRERWDTLSGKEGEELSRVVTRALHRSLDQMAETGAFSAPRTSIRLARIDVRRYAILIPQLERVQDAAKVGRKLQEQLAVVTQLDDGEATLSACIGISTFPEDGADPSSLLENAWSASSRAAKVGRNNLEYFTESMSRWAFERLTLENSLRDAIDNDELAVYYQPRVEIQTRRIVGMEALVRWIHPQLGLVSPAQFIPLAEETGLIVPIGEWVLREACRQNKLWRDRGLPDVRVSVNLSAVQFRKPELFETVCNALEETGLPHDALELEVTESMLMHDPKATVTTLQRLKSSGIHLSIDDFGTGYSSLSYLKRFPIDALKIDRSFVNEVTTNPDDAAIATAIILMGHSLKLNVVAEGVETESQLAFLRVLQCNEIQGYLFSPPVPAEKASELLLRGLDESGKEAA